MKIVEACQNCNFWKWNNYILNKKANIKGICLRYPPGLYRDNVTYKSWWCGEWRLVIGEMKIATPHLPQLCKIPYDWDKIYE